MKTLQKLGVALLFMSMLISCGSGKVQKKSSATPTIKKGSWQFSTIKMKDKYSNISGNVKLKVIDGEKLKENALVKLNINIDKAKPSTGIFKVIAYKDSDISHIWVIKSTKTGKLGTFTAFKQKLKVKNKMTSAMLILGQKEKKIIFYLY